jgi:hypothetical protein
MNYFLVLSAFCGVQGVQVGAETGEGLVWHREVLGSCKQCTGLDVIDDENETEARKNDVMRVGGHGFKGSSALQHDHRKMDCQYGGMFPDYQLVSLIQ